MIPVEEAPRHIFFLNPYADEPFPHCPRCHTSTNPRTRILLLHVKPNIAVPLKAKCRYCTECDLLIAHKHELRAELEARLPPGVWKASGGEFVAVGSLDRARLGRVPLEELTMEEALEAFRPFLAVTHFERVQDDSGVWFEEQASPSPLAASELPVPELAELERLPQTDETWEVGVRQMPVWVTGSHEEPFRPYTTLVVSPSQSVVIFQELAPKPPTPDMVRDTLWKAMCMPIMAAGEARRPATVHVDDEALAKALQPELAKLGVDCRVQRFQLLDEVFDDLNAFLADEEERLPGLLDTPGVTPELVDLLFEASAEFYRLAPWQWLYNEDLFAVRYPLPDGEWRYVSVMGNAGMEFGLAVFESLEDFNLATALIDPELAVGQITYRALSFEEAVAVPFSDLDAIEKYGWEIAAEDAYPVPLTFTRDRRVVRPGPEELEWYVVTLRAIAKFVEEYWPKTEGEVPEPIAIDLTVPLGEQEAEVELRYPADTITEEEFMAAGQQVFRFKVRRGRRGRIKHFELLGNQTLGDFDAILRNAFNLDPFDHLSGFWIAGERGLPDLELGTIEPFGGGDAADILIGFLDLEVGDMLKYVYDFGDWIEYTITLEAITDREEGVEYPRVIEPPRRKRIP